jgi:hypothetical protein
MRFRVSGKDGVHGWRDASVFSVLSAAKRVVAALRL